MWSCSDAKLGAMRGFHGGSKFVRWQDLAIHSLPCAAGEGWGGVKSGISALEPRLPATRLLQRRFTLARELLFFACAKKSNQKKARPGDTPFASLRVRKRFGNFPKPHPAARKTAYILVRRPCGVVPAPFAVPQGPRKTGHRQRRCCSAFPFSTPYSLFPASAAS